MRHTKRTPLIFHVYTITIFALTLAIAAVVLGQKCSSGADAWKALFSIDVAQLVCVSILISFSASPPIHDSWKTNASSSNILFKRSLAAAFILLASIANCFIIHWHDRTTQEPESAANMTIDHMNRILWPCAEVSAFLIIAVAALNLFAKARQSRRKM